MRTILALACVALLTACGSDHYGDLRQELARETQNLRGRVPPLPQVKPYEPVPYQGEANVDPFNPERINLAQAAAAKGGGGGHKPDFNRPREPLEAFPLDSIAMVGTITLAKETFGLVKAGQNLYRVKKGNYMGQNFGVITAIDEDQITLKELIQDSNGEWVERTSTLQLQEAKK
jgi:type IV pilus assembly protein PilP